MAVTGAPTPNADTPGVPPGAAAGVVMQGRSERGRQPFLLDVMHPDAPRP